MNNKDVTTQNEPKKDLPDEKSGILVEGYFKILDAETKELLREGRS